MEGFLYRLVAFVILLLAVYLGGWTLAFIFNAKLQVGLLLLIGTMLLWMLGTQESKK